MMSQVRRAAKSDLKALCVVRDLSEKKGILLVCSMERRLCTLICAMFFCIFNLIVILIKYTKINTQKK